MRYLQIPDVVFVDRDGNERVIKDIRPMGEYRTILNIPNNNELMLDEIVSREETYGKGAEDLTFAAFDHNAEKIMENNLDMSRLKTIKLPLIEEGF